MSEIPCSYQIKDGLVIVRAPRLLVVLTVQEWVRGIKRGRYYRRHGEFKPGKVRAQETGDRPGAGIHKA